MRRRATPAGRQRSIHCANAGGAARAWASGGAARWVDPGRRRGALAPYGRTGEQTTPASLQEALNEAGRSSIPQRIYARLAAAAQADIADLRPHLESRSMTALLERRHKRIAEAAGADDRQMAFDFDPAEQRQREADRRAWERRLKAIQNEPATEPGRIADAYTVRATRVDPLGIVYLWPGTG